MILQVRVVLECSETLCGGASYIELVNLAGSGRTNVGEGFIWNSLLRSLVFHFFDFLKFNNSKPFCYDPEVSNLYSPP